MCIWDTTTTVYQIFLDKNFTKPTCRYLCIADIFDGINFPQYGKGHHKLYVIIDIGQKIRGTKFSPTRPGGEIGEKFRLYSYRNCLTMFFLIFIDWLYLLYTHLCYSPSLRLTLFGNSLFCENEILILCILCTTVRDEITLLCTCMHQPSILYS